MSPKWEINLKQNNSGEKVQSLAQQKNLELASSNLNHFYQYPTSLIHTTTGLSIIIHCPLISKQSLFTLYRYHSLSLSFSYFKSDEYHLLY